MQTKPDQSKERPPAKGLVTGLARGGVPRWLRLDGRSPVAKYEQLVDGITAAIARGQVGCGDALPTVAALCGRFGLAKETVLKAYGVLRRRGIVRAVAKKGYYVRTESVVHLRRALLVFDEFTPYKQDLYEAFRRELPADVRHDIYFHHCHIGLFESLLVEKADDYDLCAVMPFDHPRVPAAVATLGRERVVLLDRRDGFAESDYPSIGQDFSESLFEALSSARDLFAKYRRLVAVLPRHDEQAAPALRTNQSPSVEIAAACARFARTVGLAFSAIASFARHRPAAGEACLVIDEEDLVAAVEAAARGRLRLGRDFGILAYNETSIHRIVAGGLTTVSTDFAAMGRLLARHVSGPPGIAVREIVPTKVIRRTTL